MTASSHKRPRERGVALVCALVLMLAAMLAGVSIARVVAASSASARSTRDRVLAHEAAEAALRDAERDIAASPEPGRAAHFDAPGGPGGAGFAQGCGRGAANRGLCRETTPPAWQALDLAAADHPALVPYGAYTGAQMAVGKGLLASRLPAYLIERLDAPVPGGVLGTFYRITAIGFGAAPGTQVVLQAVVRKPAPDQAGRKPDAGQGKEQDQELGREQGREQRGGPNKEQNASQAAELPAGRIGWREVANWRQLHLQAQQ